MVQTTGPSTGGPETTTPLSVVSTVGSGVGSSLDPVTHPLSNVSAAAGSAAFSTVLLDRRATIGGDSTLIPTEWEAESAPSTMPESFVIVPEPEDLTRQSLVG